MRVLRIAVVGPESSGKTTLAEALMRHFGGGRVADGTREYVEELERPYIEEDLLAMARSHAQWFADAPLHAAEGREEFRRNEPVGRSVSVEPVFFDTDILNIRIWSMEKYGRVHPGIDRLVHDLRYDLRLLCRPDIPWEPDPQRENPYDRDRLFAIWEREMKAFGFLYIVIEGSREQRLHMATSMVGMLMQGKAE
jgi:nicotinamide riboside kinase